MDIDQTATPPRVPLTLRVLGLSIAFVGAAGILSGALYLLMIASPLLVSSSSEAARQSARDALPSAFGSLLVVCVSTLAGAALWRAQAWARAWLVCVSVGQLAILGLMLATTPSNVLPEVLAAFGFTGSIGFRSALYLLGLGNAVAALYLIGYHHRTLRPPIRQITWAVTGSCILMFSGLQWWSWTDGVVYRRYARDREASRVAVSAGTGGIVVEPVFDGQRLDLAPDLPASVRLYEKRTKRDERTEARFRDGAIDVPNVETGIYSVSVVIDAERSNEIVDGRGMPGDFVSQDVDPPFWEVLADGESPRHRLRVVQLIRLLEPEDTGAGLGRPLDEYRALPSPATFSWAAVPAAEYYHAGVTRFRWTDAGWKTEWVDSHRIVGSTTWTVDLPPSGPNEHYGFDVQATGAGDRVGTFEIAGPSRRDWYYRFVVR